MLVTCGPARLSDGRIAGIVTVTIVRREALRAEPARSHAAWDQGLPGYGGAARQVAEEPVPGQPGGGIEGARLLEQVGGAGHDG